MNISFIYFRLKFIHHMLQKNYNDFLASTISFYTEMAAAVFTN